MPMTAEELKQHLDGIEQRLGQKYEETSDAVDTQAEEFRRLGTTLTESAQTIERLENEIRDEVKNREEAQQELIELRGKMDGIETVLARGGLPGGDMPGEEMRTIGAHFAESEQLKEFIEKGQDKSNRVGFKSLFSGPGQREQRAATLTNLTGGWGGMGALIDPFQINEVIMDPRRTFMMRDLMRVIPVDSPAIEFAETTGFANLYAEVAAAAAAGAVLIRLNDVSGFFSGQRVMIGTDSRVIDVNGVNAATNEITVTAGLTNAAPIGTPVTSDQLAAIPHGGRKPQASLRFEQKTASVSTIAHWIAAHRQTLADVPQLQAMIDTELRYGLALAEEDQLLWGNGQGPNITGLMVNGNVQNHGGIPAGDQRIDHLRRAITKTEIAQYPPNGIIMHPSDWEAVELLKDSQQRYLWFNIQQPNQRTLFAVPVIVTTAMPAGQFLVGSFGLGAYLFDREAANVRISESHGNFFVENMVAILGEERLGMGVVRPQSFVKGTFTPAAA